MSIVKLEITNLRNITGLHCHPSSRLNLIYGRNGSGKTSILEAIYLLGYGRSFRSGLIDSLVRYEQAKAVVFMLLGQEDGQTISIGLEKGRQMGQRVRVDNRDVHSTAELVRFLPVQLINPDTYGLLIDGPKKRRQFMDWGLFHVEPLFFPLWKRFQRCLEQRNAALKSSAIQASVWNLEFTRAAIEIDNYRAAYMGEFRTLLQQILLRLLPDLTELDVLYRRGWDNGKSLDVVLAEQIARDVQFGFTHCGPHRADLVMRYHGVSVADALSRGQQKMLVIALCVAQGVLLKQKIRATCTYLVDDLGAELDVAHRELVMELLLEMEAQLFVTGIEYRDLSRWVTVQDSSVFHVEHGSLTQQG